MFLSGVALKYLFICLSYIFCCHFIFSSQETKFIRKCRIMTWAIFSLQLLYVTKVGLRKWTIWPSSVCAFVTTYCAARWLVQDLCNISCLAISNAASLAPALVCPRRRRCPLVAFCWRSFQACDRNNVIAICYTSHLPFVRSKQLYNFFKSIAVTWKHAWVGILEFSIPSFPL
jgi:hypothetical protein